MKCTTLFAAFGLIVAAAGLLPAQDEKKCEFPKPGPEHAQLQQLTGTWDAAIKAFMEPGKPSVEFKGVETVTALGAYSVVVDHRSDMMGSYLGHGVRTFDPVKKKFVSTWSQSMGGGVMVFEGAYDDATKTYTLFADGPGCDGKPAKWKGVHAIQDASRNVFTLSVASPDGKDFVCMEITYTKRK